MYTVLSRIAFHPNLANLGCFWPFLGTQSPWIFSRWLPNIETHQDTTFFTYLEVTVVFRISFYVIMANFGQFWPILANFGCFLPFLGTQSSWKFSQWLSNIEIHQDITFYTWWGLLFSPESHFTQIWPIWAVFVHFWVPRVPENFPNCYLTLKYINI